MALQAYQPEEMRRIGGGGRGEDFAGLGGSFAAEGGGGEFMASYLQNRISALNRSTVSPRVNQMRVMKSPEFALAKTLGVSTAYNSGGSQVDVQRARQRLNSPSSMERDAAQGQLNKFYEKNKNVPMNPVLEGLGFNPAREADYAGPVGNQGAFDEIQKRFGRGGERRQEVPQTRTPAQGGQPTPTIPAPGDQAATPPSVKDAQNATRAPIGAVPTVGAGGSQTLESLPVTTPSINTTKGPRLDTDQNPPALSPVGGYEERYVVGQRGGDPNAPRGTPGYMEKENVAIGPMTNRPAKTPQEAEERIARFNAEGEAQKQRNAEAAEKKRLGDLEKQRAARFPVKDKGLPTERGYTPRRVA